MAILIWLVIIGVVGWFLAGGGLAALSGNRKKVTQAHSPETLLYAVPEGQDPAAIIALLTPRGYLVTLDDTGPERVLVISAGDGLRPDRTAVRALIAEANTAIQDPVLMRTDVRFVDEGR